MRSEMLETIIPPSGLLMLDVTLKGIFVPIPIRIVLITIYPYTLNVGLLASR